MQFRARCLLISLISSGMLYGCVSSEPTPTSTSISAGDDTAPSVELAADKSSERAFSAAYVNAVPNATNQQYKNCFDINIQATVEKRGTLVCWPLMVAGESQDYFNQPTHFLIQCPNKNFSTSAIESNVRAEFSENLAGFSINIPRADSKLPDAIRVNGMMISKHRNALVQGDSTEIIFFRDGSPWQRTIGEALDFDVVIGFAQVFYIRPDSPSRRWKFEQTYLEIKAQYADSCQLKIIVGNSTESPG